MPAGASEPPSILLPQQLILFSNLRYHQQPRGTFYFLAPAGWVGEVGVGGRR